MGENLMSINIPAKSWAWVLDHSLAANVDSLRNGGFNAIAILPYFYMSMAMTYQPDYDKEVTKADIDSGAYPREMVIPIPANGSVKYYKRRLMTEACKKEGKIIAINRGQNVRLMPYSVDNEKAMGL
jgi:hypothetical protein